MKHDEVVVGMPIAYNNANGSWGVVVAANHYGGFYVRWNYGKDVRGEAITSCASQRAEDLIPVPRELYSKYVACQAWSEEQKLLRKEWLEGLPDDVRRWL